MILIKNVLLLDNHVKKKTNNVTYLSSSKSMMTTDGENMMEEFD